jgi:hypothetical protein
LPTFFIHDLDFLIQELQTKSSTSSAFLNTLSFIQFFKMPNDQKSHALTSVENAAVGLPGGHTGRNAGSEMRIAETAGRSLGQGRRRMPQCEHLCADARRGCIGHRPTTAVAEPWGVTAPMDRIRQLKRTRGAGSTGLR